MATSSKPTAGQRNGPKTFYRRKENWEPIATMLFGQPIHSNRAACSAHSTGTRSRKRANVTLGP